MAYEIFYDKLFKVPICLLESDDYAEVPENFSGYIITQNTLEYLKKVLEVNTMFQGQIVSQDKTKETFKTPSGILMLFFKEPEQSVLEEKKNRCISKFGKEPTVTWFEKYPSKSENEDYLENILLLSRPLKTFCFFSQEDIPLKSFEMLEAMGGELYFQN